MEMAFKERSSVSSTVPADVRARSLLLFGGGHLHPAQPELWDHQETGVSRPQSHGPLQPPVRQGGPASLLIRLQIDSCQNKCRLSEYYLVSRIICDFWEKGISVRSTWRISVKRKHFSERMKFYCNQTIMLNAAISIKLQSVPRPSLESFSERNAKLPQESLSDPWRAHWADVQQFYCCKHRALSAEMSPWEFLLDFLKC